MPLDLPLLAQSYIVIEDDETGSLIDQNDIRPLILCRRRTSCEEQPTGVNLRPKIINYCLF